MLTLEKEIGPGYDRASHGRVQPAGATGAGRARAGPVPHAVQHRGTADLFQAMGTTLGKRNIQFAVPTTEDALDGAQA